MEAPIPGHELIRAADARPTTATAIKARIRLVQVEIANLESLMAHRQAEFRATLGRERAEQLMGRALAADRRPDVGGRGGCQSQRRADRFAGAARFTAVVVADADKRHAGVRSRARMREIAAIVEMDVVGTADC